MKKNNPARRAGEKNNLALILSEKNILPRTKNPSPPPRISNGPCLTLYLYSPTPCCLRFPYYGVDASAAIGHYFTIYVDWGTTGLRYLWIGFFVVLTKVYILAVCIMMSVMIGSQIFMYSHIFCIAVSKMLQDRKFVAPMEAKRKIQMWWKPAKVVLLIVGTNTITMTPVSKYI